MDHSFAVRRSVCIEVHQPFSYAVMSDHYDDRQLSPVLSPQFSLSGAAKSDMPVRWSR